MSVTLNPLHYAVVVGINFYNSRELPPLSGPMNDAEDFVRWLETDGGLHPDNIRSIPASANAADKPLRPTLAAIHEALNNINMDLLAQRADVKVVPNSRLYIFVAGHGMAQKGVTAALFSTEAVKGLWGYMLNLQGCLQWYRDSGPFEEVVMFADVCRR